MHEQYEAGQEHELRWMVKRLGAGDPCGSLEELRARIDARITELEKRDSSLKTLLMQAGSFIHLHHLQRSEEFDLKDCPYTACQKIAELTK